MNKFWSKWQDFWFKAQSPYPLAIFRIVFGILLVINFAGQYLPQYQFYFGVEPIIETSDVLFHRFANIPVFDLFLFLPHQEAWIQGFLYFCIFLAILFTLGIFTRVTTVILFLCLLTLNNHFPMILHAGDNYCRLVLLFMCFAPSQAVLSVDSYFSKEDNACLLIEAWPQRLIQVQLTYVYFINWIYKVMSTQWTEGSAVYYATRLTQYYRFPLPPLLDTPYGSMIISWLTIIIEFALFALIWPKRTRYWILVIGAVFHIGLDWCFNLGVFEWFFIATFILFIDPSDFKNKKIENFKNHYIEKTEH